MTEHMFGNGKVSYMQIPAKDTFALADFYEAVFGWQIRRGDGNAAHLSFMDGPGELIGAFISALAPASDPGVIPYIYVHGIDAAIDRITSNGGTVAKEPYQEGELWVAWFRDPASNVLGIWQQGPR